tara:strand:- start:798 stop:1793 length:996 start_codon:yes stop_codon:yes gene_type:complete
MKKFLVVIFFLFFLIVIIFLSQPQLRHIVFNGIVQFPEFAVMKAIKGGLTIRDFDKVIPWLERQHDLADLYGESNNKMVTGLTENIKKAFEYAVLDEERSKFISILEKNYSLNDRNIDLILMLAKAYKSIDSQKSKYFLNKALEIVPSDIRIYQLANIMFMDEVNSAQGAKWCSLYKINQFGDYKKSEGSSLLGIGYRRLAFEYEFENKRRLILNEGLRLGEKVSYEFLLGENSYFLNPSLRISNGGGIEIVFHEIKMFFKGELVKTFKDEIIGLFPETGFILDNKVISTNKDGENIYIKIPNIDKIQVDKVAIDLTISKLSLNNSISCKN